MEFATTTHCRHTIRPVLAGTVSV